MNNTMAHSNFKVTLLNQNLFIDFGSNHFLIS